MIQCLGFDSSSPPFLLRKGDEETESKNTLISWTLCSESEVKEKR